MAVDRPEIPSRPQSRGDEIRIQGDKAKRDAEALAASLRPPPPVPVPDENLIKRHARRMELLLARRRASRANVQLSQRQSVGPAPGSTLGA